MLVLGRRVGEKIQIGDDIVITVLESRGDNVRIGIEAPRSIAVVRAEVIAAIGDANRSSARASDATSGDELLRLLGHAPTARTPRIAV